MAGWLLLLLLFFLFPLNGYQSEWMEKSIAKFCNCGIIELNCLIRCHFHFYNWCLFKVLVDYLRKQRKYNETISMIDRQVLLTWEISNVILTRAKNKFEKLQLTYVVTLYFTCIHLSILNNISIVHHRSRTSEWIELNRTSEYKEISEIYSKRARSEAILPQNIFHNFQFLYVLPS